LSLTTVRGRGGGGGGSCWVVVVVVEGGGWLWLKDAVQSHLSELEISLNSDCNFECIPVSSINCLKSRKIFIYTPLMTKNMSKILL